MPVYKVDILKITYSVGQAVVTAENALEAKHRAHSVADIIAYKGAERNTEYEAQDIEEIN